nr:LysR family transcriptional regulator [Thalassotalea sp. G2M2-11]
MEHYAFFTVIVEEGSMTNAAARLGIPKSKLSRRLAVLEQQLGTQLLIRTTRAQHLTESGLLLYQHCKPHVDALFDAQHLVNDAVSSVKGKLSLLLPLEFFNKVIGQLITDFALAYPAVEIHCHHYSQYQPDIDYQYDLVFVLHEQPLPSSQWIAKTLLSFPQSIYCGQGYSHLRCTALNDLTKQQAIVAKPKEAWLFRQNNKTLVISPKTAMMLSSPEMRVQACQQGIGLLKLPDYIGKADHKLRSVKLPHALVALQLSLLYQNRTIAAKTRVFLDYFQSKIGCLSE